MKSEQCKQCGAWLNFSDMKAGILKCSYCDTEYHVDNCGKIEEYYVYLDVMGKRRKFYISEFKTETLCTSTGRNMTGSLIRIPVVSKMKINLVEI